MSATPLPPPTGATEHTAVTVSVPARAGFLHVIRAVVGSVAAHHDLTVDGIEDLRIAVDEACAQLIRAGGAQIVVRVAPSPAGVQVVCHTDAEVVAWPPEGIERTLAAQVLHGLADEVAWERTDGRPAVRMSKHAVAGP
ncbi:MAG TPA: ATP-binding protein [Actinomycetota bacterium]